MKQQLTTDLGEFTALVERYADSAQDYLVQTDVLAVHSNEDGTTISIPPDTEDGNVVKWPVNEYAHSQIAARLQIPKAYYERMRKQSPSLLDANIGNWLNNPVERRMLRTLDGKVRAYLSDRYARIDHIDIMRVINPVLREVALLHPEMRVESSALTDKKMYLKVVVPTIQAEVQVGDIVQAGFIISNSEVGAGMFSVEQFIYTLRCKNGMTAGERLARRHLGSRIPEGSDLSVWSEQTKKLDDATIMSAAQDMIRAAVDETRFQAIVGQLREAVTTPPMVAPTRTVERLAKKHSLSDDEAASVLGAVQMDQGANGLGLYGLLNGVTRTANHVESYERASELEKLGGTLLEMPRVEWEAYANLTP